MAAARTAVIRTAWMHDGALTLIATALLVTHMTTQSLRGDAAGWNQWRAASFGAAAWVGTLCIASKMFGHDPAYLPFLGEPFVPCLLYTSPSPRDATLSRMPSSA